MQLEVKFQEIKPVESNFDTLKIELKDQLEKYQNLVVVESELPKYKSDRAKLNSLKKALNDERIRVKKEFTAPITAFEGQVKELIGLVDEPINCLDDQLKKYEEKRRQEKRSKIEEKFNELNDIDQLKFTMVYDESWLNVAVSMKKISDAITEHIERIHADQKAITDLKSDFEEDLHELYLKTFNLATVLSEKTKRDAIIAQAEAKRKAQEAAEAARKAEAERIEKERIEREAKEAQEAKEREAQAEIERLKAELENKKEQQLEQVKLDYEKPDEKLVVEQKAPETIGDIQQIDFRVWVNPEQKIAIRNFLIENNIKYGAVN